MILVILEPIIKYLLLGTYLAAATYFIPIKILNPTEIKKIVLTTMSLLIIIDFTGLTGSFLIIGVWLLVSAFGIYGVPLL